MSRMLTFFDAAWASARDCATAGRRADALAFLAPFFTSPDAPPRQALLAHRLAARLHAAGENYRKARKHLLTAEAADPGNAEVQYELGLAFESDPYGCDRRAARRFRAAVRLAPGNPRYEAALGRALVRIDRVRAGVRRLTAVAAAAPVDAALLKVVVDGLCDAGRVKRAGAIVAKARFLAPTNKAIRQVWDEVRFAAARAGQARQERTTVGPRPKLLPFLRLVTGERTARGEGGVVRRDAASKAAPHLGRLRAFRG